MKMKFFLKTFALITIITALYGCQSVDKKPSENNSVSIIKSGEMSDIMFAHVSRTNTIADHISGVRHEFPGGLEFYFIIRPKKTYNSPTIRDYQNFKINGVSYKRTTLGTINPLVEIFNYNDSNKYEPVNVNLSPFFVKDGYVVRVIICGEKLPNTGEINYTFNFGFDKNVEEFDFLFNLEEIL